jgi:hypothetical protein
LYSPRNRKGKFTRCSLFYIEEEQTTQWPKEEEQTTQWPKEKVPKNKQRSTKLHDFASLDF